MGRKVIHKFNLSLLFKVVTTFLPKTRDSSFERRDEVKIVLDEAKKDGVLLKEDGTEISRYSYKNLITENYSLEEFKKELESFNVTLGQQEEFDNIKELSKSIKIHNW